jgi:small subunit ribosomal protein S9
MRSAKCGLSFGFARRSYAFHLASPTTSSFCVLLSSSSQNRHNHSQSRPTRLFGYTKPICLHTRNASKNFEDKESRYDWLPLKEKLWPEQPPLPTDYRSYVPPAEEDEEDNWKPAEELWEPTMTREGGDSGKPFPPITPTFRPQKINAQGVAHGVGRRKKAVARVWLKRGTGQITVNHREFANYFPPWLFRSNVIAPFVATERLNEFDTEVIVKGGGVSAQSQAVQLAIARALQNYNPAFRPPLKLAGYLRGDARQVQSKKAGFHGARRKKQWSKR